MAGDVVVHSLGPAGVGHADVVVHQQLRDDPLLGGRGAARQGGVRGVEVRGGAGSDPGAAAAPAGLEGGDDGVPRAGLLGPE